MRRPASERKLKLLAITEMESDFFRSDMVFGTAKWWMKENL